MSPTTADQKLQRWIDLLAALLCHHFGVTFADLRREVPAYAAAKDPGALARMFERDKDELRAIGIPITTRDPLDDEQQRYRVDPREMYLPYLTLVSRAGKSSGAVKKKPGYRTIPELAFEPDELRALVDGAREVSRAGDDLMAADAEFALRKLAFDLDVPVGSVLGESQDAVLTPREPATAGKIRALGEALLRLKRVSFDYQSMSSDTVSARTVEPYGLFFLSGHWYLAARDVEKNDIRNFRVSRMRTIQPNKKKAQSVDFEVPREFRLSDHARQRGPWELGDGDAEEMVVEFRGESGATAAASQLGAASSRGERCRTFHVRRVDSFVRWLLSFAGEVVPVYPPSLVNAYRATARATMACYGGDT